MTNGLQGEWTGPRDAGMLKLNPLTLEVACKCVVLGDA